MRWRKFLTLLLLGVFCFGLLPPLETQPAWAGVSDPRDLGNLSQGQQIIFDNAPDVDMVFDAYWKVYSRSADPRVPTGYVGEDVAVAA